MVIKNNFQRNLVVFLLILFNDFCLGSIFFILKYFYNVYFLHILLIFLLNGLYFCFFWVDYSNKIFFKYCNKDCLNCSIWSCNFYKNSKGDRI